MNTKTAIEILRSAFWGHAWNITTLITAVEIATPVLKAQGWNMHYGSNGIYTLWSIRHHRQDTESYDPLFRPFWFRRRLVELDSGKYGRLDEGLPF